MESPRIRTVLAGFGFALLLVHVSRILPPRIIHAFQALKRELRRPRSGLDDELDKAVGRRLHQWQREQFVWCVSMLSLLQLCTVTVFAMDATFKLDFNVFGLGVTQQRSTWHAAVVLGNYGFSLLILRFSESMSLRNINVWFWLLTLPMALAKSPLLCGHGVRCPHETIERLSYVLVLVGRMDVTHCACGSLAFCGSAAAWWFLDKGVPDLDETRNDVLAIAFSLFFVWFLRSKAKLQVRATVELEFLQQQQQALRALLNNFYDVVLELDGELRVVTGGEELGTFLLQNSRGRLQGRPLLDFLQEEESRRLLEHLRPCVVGQSSMADVVHVQMHSADGDRQLPVELFCFTFEGLQGAARHLVGLREYGDETHGVPRQAEEGPSTGEEELAVYVDAGDPELAVLWSSPAFQLLIGPARGLSAQLCGAANFSLWLQAASNAWLGGMPCTNSASSCTVTFRARGGMQLWARCTLEEVCDEEEDGILQSRLVFRQLERRCCRSDGEGSSSGVTWERQPVALAAL